MTFAPTPEVDQQILNLGLEGYIDSQLALNTPHAGTEARISNYTALRPTMSALRSARDNDDRLMEHELVHAAFIRAIYSPHQVFEVLQRLWLDHFNISFGDNNDHHLTAHYQEQVLRPNGMGRFRDLLVATAHSPGMMLYLDNWISDARSGINENYGRELLELHTLGIDLEGNKIYTEDDVVGASHVMSGWSLTERNTPVFQYKPEYHSTEPISLLGGQWTNAGLNGKDAGDSLLAFLASHPQTARYVSTKLIRRFVTDNPPEALIASAAQVYLNNDTNIVPVIRHILGSAAFANSAGQKLRRPFEQIAASARALGVETSNDPESQGAERVFTAIGNLSHRPFDHSTPDGYPDVAEPWLSSGMMLRRWESGATMARNRYGSDGTMVYDVAALRGSANTALELFERLTNRLNLGQLSAQTRAEVFAVLDISDDTLIDDFRNNDFQDLVSFLTAHPFFQLR